MRGPVIGIVLIVIGAVMLANNLGVFNVNLAHLLRVWWPAILIVLGASYLVSPRR